MLLVACHWVDCRRWILVGTIQIYFQKLVFFLVHFGGDKKRRRKVTLMKMTELCTISFERGRTKKE